MNDAPYLSAWVAPVRIGYSVHTKQGRAEHRYPAAFLPSRNCGAHGQTFAARTNNSSRPHGEWPTPSLPLLRDTGARSECKTAVRRPSTRVAERADRKDVKNEGR